MAPLTDLNFTMIFRTFCLGSSDGTQFLPMKTFVLAPYSRLFFVLIYAFSDYTIFSFTLEILAFI